MDNIHSDLYDLCAHVSIIKTLSNLFIVQNWLKPILIFDKVQ